MVEIEVPDLGTGATEGELLRWHVAPGDGVSEGNVLTVVETSKATVDIPAPLDGTVDERRAEEGDVVRPGEVLATITAESAGDTAGERVFAPPNVRRLARELDVDIGTVTGSGPSGRITEADVRASAKSADEESESADEKGESTKLKSAVSRVSDVDEGTVSEEPDEATDDDREPKSAIRRIGTAGERSWDDHTTSGSNAETTERQIRRKAVRDAGWAVGGSNTHSRRDVPQATHHDLAEVEALVDARDRLGPLAQERGVRLTTLPFVLKSVAAALSEHPNLNAEFDEKAGEILYKKLYDVRIWRATDTGRTTSVVDAVDEKGILELAAELNQLHERTSGQASGRSETRDGTFTVRDFGAVDGEFATPVLDVRQTGTLGIGVLKDRAVVVHGEVVARPTLPLSVTVDHRVVDGADATRFVHSIKRYLSDPTLLLLE